MIKKSIKLIILVFLANMLFAQHTFEKIISDSENQIINRVIEDDDGNFIMAGRIRNNETEKYAGYLIKIDNNGDLIQEEIISPNDTTSCLFLNIHYFNNYIYILGSEMVISPNVSKLWYLKLNTNLEIEDEKFLNIPYGKWFSYMNSIIDSDSNFTITGYTSRLESNYYNNDAYFYKINLDGDSLNSMFYTKVSPINFSFDIIESQDSSKYYAFVSHFTNIFGCAGQRLVLDKNLDSLDIDSIPLMIYDYYSPIHLNDTDILICGKKIPWSANEVSLNVISINEEAELIDYNQFNLQNDMRDSPAMYSGVSKNEDNIYIGGTSNFDNTNPFYSTKDSWFHLIKINSDISPIWEYWYGGDAYYLLYSTLATNDGGCLLVGNRYDYETQDQERDIYIVKVNSDGLIVWTQEIPMVKQTTTVFPNPGTNQLSIKTDFEEFDFELISLNGQVVIQQFINSGTISINTKLVVPGIYFYKLVDKKSQTIETGKWIKK